MSATKPKAPTNEWSCKLDEGPAGLSYVRWSPDSRHLLTISQFQVMIRTLQF